MSTSSTRVDGDHPIERRGDEAGANGHAGRIAFAWAVVGIPLAYGVFETAKKAAALFTG